MKRTAGLALVLAASALALVACSSDADDPPRFEEATPSLTDELARLTGAPWAANPHPVTGKPSLFLSLDDGRPVLASATAPSEALAFLEPLREGIGVHEPLANELTGVVVTKATTESLGVLRFEQHVPGTDVPVFDGPVFVGVTVDGRLGYVESWAASGLETFDATPAITLERALEIVLSVAPGAEIGTGAYAPMLGVRAIDPDHPRLVFRVSIMAETSRLIDVDAKTGAIVANDVTSIAGTEALLYSAESHLPPTDRRHALGKVLSVPVNGMNIGGPIASGELIVREDIPACAEDHVAAAKSHPIPAVWLPAAPTIPGTADLRITTRCDSRARRERTKAMAVDAAHHVAKIAEYYANQLEMPHWGKNDIVQLMVHDDTITGNAVFEAQGMIRISDAMPASAEYGPRRYSPATSLEFLAHEYTHGVIQAVTSGRLDNPRMVAGTGLGVSGEAGALNEGIADVLAGGIEALLTGSGARLWGFAPELRTDGKPFRDYIKPSRGADGGSVHFDVKAIAFDSKEDAGGIHVNSLLVTQAWALMVRGGYNAHSKLGVTAEIDLPLSIRLFWETLRSMAGTTATLRSFAEKMLVHQRDGIPAINPSQTNLQKKWVKHTLVCAWTAVGVLTRDIAKSRYGVTCPEDGSEVEPPNCKGRADGVYCDSRPAYDYNAFECRNGSIKVGAQCASGKYCYRTKGTFKSFADTGPDGRAVCHDEPQAD